MELEGQIKAIEEELKRTPYNKATQHHIGKLKAKLAKLRAAKEKFKVKRRKTRAGIRKCGNATIGLIGYPNVGKSTLLNELTNAKSSVGEYEFTTLSVVPGMLDYKGAKLQILDLPGLISGASKGRGRGGEIISVVRILDLAILMLDCQHLEQLDIILEELYNAGVRLNSKPPDIVITKKPTGGITVSSTVKLTKLDERLVTAILQEYGYVNADVIIREDVDEEQLIDFIAGNRAYVKCFVVVNKIDMMKDSFQYSKIKDLDVVAISAKQKIGIEELKSKIFSTLEFIRVYLKLPEVGVDYKRPLVIKRNSTVEQVCDIIHKDFKEKFKYALVWGASAKFEGQRVGLGHMLKDGDVLSIVVTK
ncbi:MAG: GTP-binding protein [Candidatus Thermoplasmatota archaeon]|nr:GTP-binding protein [Candidatus Thermoplasmatota archaeon]